MLQQHSVIAPGPEVYHRAVEVLRMKRQMSEAAAYDALVRCSVAWRVSVRESAIRVIKQLSADELRPAQPAVRGDATPGRNLSRNHLG
jgi:hypothetical protein